MDGVAHLEVILGADGFIGMRQEMRLTPFRRPLFARDTPLTAVGKH